MNHDRYMWLKRLWASKPTVGISLAAVLTSGTALASAGIFHYREFAHQLWHGEPPQVMAASMAAAAFALAAIAIRVNEIHSSQRKDSKELRRMLATAAERTSLVDRLVTENETLSRKVETLSGRGYEEDDVEGLWQPAPGTGMLSFNGVFNRETEEARLPEGTVVFTASEWAIRTWLPRITRGTHLSDWRIVVVIPKVVAAFDSLAWYPARKLIAVLDDLASIAARRGIKTTFDHIRISVVQEVNPEHRFRSIHVLNRRAETGPLPTVITYHRPHTSRAVDYNNGKVTVHPGVADQSYWKGVAEHYFFSGVQMTVAQMRNALISGSFPECDDRVLAVGDHLRIA